MYCNLFYSSSVPIKVCNYLTHNRPKSKMLIDLWLGGSDNAGLTSSSAWANILSPDWRMCVSHALHCRKCEYSHFHHCSLDQVTSGPTFPCHKEEGFLQIQRAKIQGGLAGEGCLDYFHAGKSAKEKTTINKKKPQTYEPLFSLKHNLAMTNWMRYWWSWCLKRHPILCLQLNLRKMLIYCSEKGLN